MRLSHQQGAIGGLMLLLLTACTASLANSIETTPVFSTAASAPATSTPLGIAVTPTATLNPAPTSDPACSDRQLQVPAPSHFEPVKGVNALAYSGNGLSLAFLSTDKTLSIHPISELNLTGADRNFAWSPDATHIAFVYGDSQPAPCGVGYLMLADLSNGLVRPLDQTLERYSQPIWSPDGEWLAVTDGNGQLKVVRVSDGQSMTLSNRAAPLHTPAWLDTKHVVYIQPTVPDQPANLVGQPVDGSAERILLSDIHISEFALSPDSRYVAYSGGLSELADLQTGTQQDLGSELTERLQWSLDGQYLLGRGGEAGLYLARPPISMAVTQVNFYGVPGLRQSWSPDNRSFAALVGDDKLPVIGIYQVETQSLKRLGVTVQAPWSLAWSPQ